MRALTVRLAGFSLGLAFSGWGCGEPSLEPTPTPTPTPSAQAIHETRKLMASDPAAGDRFGRAVSVWGDVAIAGTPNYPTAGATCVFYRNHGGSGNWGQIAKIAVPVVDVAVSGDVAVVGWGRSIDVLYRNRGGADTWGQVARRAPTGGFEVWSVAVSGDVAVLGTSFTCCGRTPTRTVSQVYVFQRNEGGADNWGQLLQIAGPEDPPYGHFLGQARVSVSGDTIVLGLEGATHIFYRHEGGTDRWGQVAKLTVGAAASVSGDTVIVGSPGNDDGGENSGAAYVFQRNQGGTGSWGQVARLSAPDAAAWDLFGGSVAVSGDIAVVGADGDDDGGDASGSAYVFRRNQGGTDNWGLVAKLTASDAAAGDSLGTSVAVSGATAVVGAERYAGPGSAYVFVLD